MTNKILIFPEDAVEILYQILKENGLEQSRLEIITKIKEGKPFWGQIVSMLMRKLVEQQITQEQFIENLVKELSINKQKAKKIFQELNTRILNRVQEKEETQTSQDQEETKSQSSFSDTNSDNTQKQAPSATNAASAPKNTSKDLYREPIE